MVHWLLSTTRCKTFALIGRCLRRGVVILQRTVEILQRVVDWAVRLQRPAIDMAYLEVVGFSDLATQSAVDGIHDSLEHLVGR